MMMKCIKKMSEGSDASSLVLARDRPASTTQLLSSAGPSTGFHDFYSSNDDVIMMIMNYYSSSREEHRFISW